VPRKLGIGSSPCSPLDCGCTFTYLCQLDICDVYVKAAAAAKHDDEDDVSDGDGDGSATEKCNKHFFDLHS